ncbi:MAG: hypothetical protein LKJ90_07435 [Faecalibacterium sp.]|jgi:hypothetical protein|nr:hypothetical protein [Faecalibacterium sp.]
MENQTECFNRAFFKTLEDGIEKLPQSTREELYRPCAINCVQNFVLRAMVSRAALGIDGVKYPQTVRACL